MDGRWKEEGEEDWEPDACYPFGRMRVKNGKVNPLWVNCQREERCMVDLVGVAVDVGGKRARYG